MAWYWNTANSHVRFAWQRCKKPAQPVEDWEGRLYRELQAKHERTTTELRGSVI